MMPVPAAEGRLSRIWSRVRLALPSGTELPEPLFRRSDRLMRIILWAHVPALVLLALAVGAEAHVLLEPLLVAALALAAQAGSSRVWRACVTSAGLITASALLVHITGGLPESHFHFFVMIALIALYQDWRPFLVAAGFVVAHHGLAGTLLPEAVYRSAEAVAHPVWWAVLHGGAIAAASAVQLLYWRTTESAYSQIAAAREHERRLTERAEAAERSGALLGITAALSQAVTQADVARVLVRDGAATIAASACSLAVLEANGRRLRLVDQTGPTERTGRWATLPLDFPSPLTEAVTTMSPVHVADPQELSRRYPELFDEIGNSSAWAAVPLEYRGRVVGGWLLEWQDPRDFSEQDLLLLSTLAALGAQALERARLYDHERESARLLQRGLLPTALPDLPGVRLAAQYHPGADGAEVGGDWYDVQRLPGGKIGVAVGDVTGHDLEAAATMGQIRTTLRAYAAEGHPPAAVMDRLNRLLVPTGDEATAGAGRLATCIYLELDPQTASVRVTSAGHPPPLFIPARGTPRLIDIEPDLPLGIESDTSYAERTLHFPIGSTLVLYTDGLVEDRDMSLQVGLDRLVTSAAAAPDGSLTELAEFLVSPMHGRERADDITLLALQYEPVLGAGNVCRLPAERSSAGTARRFVRQCLERSGCGHLADTAAQLVSELAANTVLHTTSRELEVEVATAGTSVRIDVRDASPHPPVGRETLPTGSSGRGLAIIEALALDWGVDPTADGKSVWFTLRR